MPTPRIVLATLCLNEMEHLPRLWDQHRDWPGVVAWVFVEAADRVYAEANPGMVTAGGLSTDGTTEWLLRPGMDPRMHYVAHGFCSSPQRDQGKVEARQRYMDVAADYRPNFVFVLDADEYYTRADQVRVNRVLQESQPNEFAFVFRQRHLFRPPGATWADPFRYEVTGGYWGVPHVRGWRWERGVKYSRNHNWLQDRWGAYLQRKGKAYRGDKQPGTPECVHMGYASCGKTRAAKHSYYVARGEGSERGPTGRTRGMYVECRRAWEGWRDGDRLPHGARVVEYNGPRPECFTKEVASA